MRFTFIAGLMAAGRASIMISGMFCSIRWLIRGVQTAAAYSFAHFHKDKRLVTNTDSKPTNSLNYYFSKMEKTKTAAL
jgi:hypothetical protein